MVLHGVTIQNSPAWNLHPYFSDNLRFLELTILNPWDSPNTDGIDPESVDGLEVAGVYFSLGDDCIAIKSGKYYMGHKYKVPSKNIYIHQCCMNNGHGAVTIGSEMAAGAKHVRVENCLFYHTDRGPVSYTHLDVYKRQGHMYGNNQIKFSVGQINKIVVRLHMSRTYISMVRLAGKRTLRFQIDMILFITLHVWLKEQRLFQVIGSQMNLRGFRNTGIKHLHKIKNSGFNL